MYTANTPKTTSTVMATYTDVVATLYTRNDPEKASSLLEIHLNLIEGWSTKWRTKINPDKSVRVPFTLIRSDTF